MCSMIAFFKSSKGDKTIILRCKDVTIKARALVLSRGMEQAFP